MTLTLPDFQTFEVVAKKAKKRKPVHESLYLVASHQMSWLQVREIVKFVSVREEAILDEDGVWDNVVLSTDDIPYWLTDDEVYLIGVFRQRDNKCVGYLVFQDTRASEAGGFHLDVIEVDHKLRGLKVGDRLMNAFLKVVDDVNSFVTLFNMSRHDPELGKFYGRYGFVETARVAHAYQTGISLTYRRRPARSEV